MERKCSHMWKCFILCTFNPQDSTAAKDRDSHEGVKKKIKCLQKHFVHFPHCRHERELGYSDGK